MRLSNYILKNLECILQEWEDFAASLFPADEQPDRVTLRDHGKLMLEAIAADLARPETEWDADQKAKGNRDVKDTAAASHGVERLGLGLSLTAALAEYRALRASVTRLWQDSEKGKPISATTNKDLVRFNAAIDQAVSESVVSYSFAKEHQSRVFETILSTSPDLGYTFDLEGRFSYANKALVQLFQLPLEKIVGSNYFDLQLPNAAELQGQIQHVITTNEQFRGEMSWKEASGEIGFFEYIYAPVLDQEGKVVAVAGTARNVTERKAAEDKNWKKANYDLLTGLPNRRLFRDRLEQNVKHAGRIGAPVALLFIDLDHFKEVNDKLGHEAGDLLLRLVADRLRSCVRETDTVARLGGDEFTVILQDLIGSGHVELVAGKILNELASPFQIFNDTVHISASIGIAFSSKDAPTPEELIKNADQAMYEAKNAGRNQFSVFGPDQTQSVGARLRLVADLRVALPQHQLAVYYQPIFDIADGRIVKAEALLRWNHPERGLMLPGQFIGPAEDAGLVNEMNEIGNFVFTEAAMRSREWSALLGTRFQISINMSVMQFSTHPNTMNWGAYIKSLGLPSQSISVDIKEEVLANGSAEVSERIADLHDAGVGLAVEGFGIGHLSMAHLKKRAIDTIKIDRSLVHDTTTDGSGQTTTKAIIVKAHKLGLKVIAECVETTDQREWLQEAGCDYAQGYLFAAPVRAEDFEKLLQPV